MAWRGLVAEQKNCLLVQACSSYGNGLVSSVSGQALVDPSSGRSLADGHKK